VWGGNFLRGAMYKGRGFGLNNGRFRLAKPDAMVLHPGRMNRGVEIDPAIADGSRSVILDQVESGVAVRMAVLWMLALARDAEKPQSFDRVQAAKAATG